MFKKLVILLLFASCACIKDSRWFFESSFFGLVSQGNFLTHGLNKQDMPVNLNALASNITLPQIQSKKRVETPEQKKQRYLKYYLENVEYKNNMILQFVPYSDKLPFFVRMWMRNWLGANLVYFTVGSIWCYYIYFVFRQELFGDKRIPSPEDLMEQAKLSFKGFPIYCLFPTITEFIICSGYTQIYTEVQDVGWFAYFFYMALFFVWIEFGGYWVHRWLHENPWAYKNLHALHHKFNREDQLSPFAGVAFNPFDGLCLASPYAVAILAIPMHMNTYQFIMTGLSIWTISVHDQIHAGVYPLLGGGYHAVHHMGGYNYNYGNHFIFMDKWMGTLKTPWDFEKEMKELKEL